MRVGKPEAPRLLKRSKLKSGAAFYETQNRIRLILSRHYSDNAHHRRAKVAVAVLDSAVRTGSDWLVVRIEVRVEATVIHKRTFLFEE